MDRSFDTVKDLNLFRKEMTNSLAAQKHSESGIIQVPAGVLR